MQASSKADIHVVQNDGASSSESGVDRDSSAQRSMIVECSNWNWDGQVAHLGPNGKLAGLPQDATFDGNGIVFEAEQRRGGRDAQSWAKLGCWRLEVVRKLAGVTAALGFTVALTAAGFYPHLTLKCGPIYNTTSVQIRAPIEVVFLLDASSSMDANSWRKEQEAVKTIVDAFTDVYGDDADRINVGLTQFSDRVQVDVPLTNDLQTNVFSRIPPRGLIAQLGGTTDYDKAIRSCTQQLTSYTGVGSDAFKVCVMTTDGSCTDCPSNAALRGIIHSAGAQFMGIYIGSDDVSAEGTLSEIACGSTTPCEWYSSAAGYNFEKLKSNAAKIAEAIATGAQEHTETKQVLYDCGRAPLWTLSSLLLMLPCFAWWLYLRIEPSRHKSEPPVEEFKHKDPDRLRVAGINRARPASLPPPATTPREERGRVCWCCRFGLNSLSSSDSE